MARLEKHWKWHESKIEQTCSVYVQDLVVNLGWSNFAFRVWLLHMNLNCKAVTDTYLFLLWGNLHLHLSNNLGLWTAQETLYCTFLSQKCIEMHYTNWCRVVSPLRMENVPVLPFHLAVKPSCCATSPVLSSMGPVSKGRTDLCSLSSVSQFAQSQTSVCQAGSAIVPADGDRPAAASHVSGNNWCFT